MSKKLKLASIWAQDSHGVIGTGTAMLWRVPADLDFFKKQTTGSVIIMGRASWEALGGALPGRQSIVITRNEDYHAEGAIVAHSLNEAIAIGSQKATDMGAHTVWITGGGKVYAQSINLVDELVVTSLDLSISPLPETVAMAPKIDLSVWTIDRKRSDDTWRPKSGDAKWKITTYVRK